VIVESAALDDPELARVTETAIAAGADYVKTSTGFHPAGGATVHAVELIVAHAGGRGVKASGGIRTADQALAILAAGATRLGCSATAAILGALA
jgi:deoxyribose-phosphate aldolase